MKITTIWNYWYKNRLQKRWLIWMKRVLQLVFLLFAFLLYLNSCALLYPILILFLEISDFIIRIRNWNFNYAKNLLFLEWHVCSLIIKRNNQSNFLPSSQNEYTKYSNGLLEMKKEYFQFFVTKIYYSRNWQIPAFRRRCMDVVTTSKR